MKKILSFCLFITTINLQTADRNKDLTLAIWYNDVGFIQENITEENVNKLMYGDSALHHAARLGRTDVLHTLIYNKKAEVNITNIDGRTAFHHAAQFSHKSIAEILLQHGADAAIKDNNGKTPWRLALENGAMGIIELLDDLEDFREIT